MLGFFKGKLEVAVLQHRTGRLIADMRNSVDSGCRLTGMHKDYPRRITDARKIISGGAVKYAYLESEFGDAGLDASIIYAVSSSHHEGCKRLMTKAKELGAKIVWNQNGTYFPLAYPSAMVDRGNRQMSELLHMADRVLYQSEFCRLAADRFLGRREEGVEVLYNAIDMDAFCPPDSRPRDFTMLICGSHHDPYRLPLAVETLVIVRRTIADARLAIAGRVSEEQLKTLRALIATLGVADAVDISGTYEQKDAPSIYGAAHVLLHTKYADPCPSVVLEAMGCGLAVVYSKTGGTPELVGEDGGCGVETPLDWYEARPPSAGDLAACVCRVAATLPDYSEAARQRAVDRFNLKDWLRRHRDLFEELSGELND